MSKKTTFVLSMLILTAVIAVACALLFVSADSEPAVLGSSGTPDEAVTGFFECVKNGKYEQAQKYLCDNVSLGMESKFSSASTEKLYNAVTESYDFSLAENASVQNTEAVQPVSFSCFSIPAAEEDITKYTQQYYADLTRNMTDNSEVYDANNNVLESVANSLFEQALDTVLQNSEDYIKQTELEINLKYTEGSWKIVADDTLLAALCGEF